MSKHTMNGGIRMVFGAVALVLLSGFVLALRADDQSRRGAKPTGLAKDLIGTWVLVGTPYKVGEVPKSGGRLKFITGKHWTITEADPDTDHRLQTLAEEIDLPYVRANLSRILARTREGVQRVARIVQSLRGLARTSPAAFQDALKAVNEALDVEKIVIVNKQHRLRVAAAVRG